MISIHFSWLKLVTHDAELDVLISLAIASDFYEGPACCPTIVASSLSSEVPCLSAKKLGHPVLRSDSLGKGAFVPNDISIGGSGCASFILLTGPNMGGKSTLLRQVCLAVILAQVNYLSFKIYVLPGNHPYFPSLIFSPHRLELMSLLKALSCLLLTASLSEWVQKIILWQARVHFWQSSQKLHWCWWVFLVILKLFI